jgi:hypothetical protein
MRVVEVQVGWPAFAEALSSIRSWLDHNDRPLVRFETEVNGAAILVRVQFEDDRQGEAFAQDFGGTGPAVRMKARS